MSQQGWISLHRQIMDCWIWTESEPFDMRSAWIDLLMLASHKDTKIMFNKSLHDVSRGQYVTSYRFLADRWKWSTKKVSKFLSVLENDGMVSITRSKKETLLTVENYGFYQDGGNDKETMRKQSGNSEETVRKQSGNTNNNVNNYNNYNNVNNNIYIGVAEVDSAFEDFMKMRKKIKSPMSDRAITIAKNKLLSLAGNDHKKMVLILEQSIFNGWKGLFELQGDFLEEYKKQKQIPEQPEPEEPELTDEEWVAMMEQTYGHETAI